MHPRSKLYWEEREREIPMQYPDCFLFLQCLTACLTILWRFLSYKWNVRPILAMSWQPHCMLTQIWVAGSAAPCFDLPLLQRTVSKPSLLLSSCGRSKFPTAQFHHPEEYTFFICKWHTLQCPLLWCIACSQNFPLTSLPLSQYIVHKMRRL